MSDKRQSWFSFTVNPAMISRQINRQQWKEIHRWLRVSAREVSLQLETRKNAAMIEDHLRTLVNDGVAISRISLEHRQDGETRVLIDAIPNATFRIDYQDLGEQD